MRYVMMFFMIHNFLIDESEMPFILQENLIDRRPNYQSKKDNHWLNRSPFRKFFNPSHKIEKSNESNHHYLIANDYKISRKIFPRQKRSEYPRQTILYPLKYRTLITNARNYEYPYSVSESAHLILENVGTNLPVLKDNSNFKFNTFMTPYNSTDNPIIETKLRDRFHNLPRLNQRNNPNTDRTSNLGFRFPFFKKNRTYASLNVTHKEINASNGKMYPSIKSEMANLMKVLTVNPLTFDHSTEGFKIWNSNVGKSQQLQQQLTPVNGKKENSRTIQKFQSTPFGNSSNIFAIPPLNNKRSQQTWRTFNDESKRNFRIKPFSPDRYLSHMTTISDSIKTILGKNFFHLPLRFQRQWPNSEQNQQYPIPSVSGNGKENNFGPPWLSSAAKFKNASNSSSWLYPSKQNQESWQPFEQNTRGNSKQILFLSDVNPSESAFDTNKKADVNQTFFQVQFPDSDHRSYTEKAPIQLKTAKNMNGSVVVPKQNAQFQFLQPALKSDVAFMNYPTMGQGYESFFPSTNINRNQEIWPQFNLEAGNSFQQSPFLKIVKPATPFPNTNIKNQQYQLPDSGLKYYTKDRMILNQPTQTSPFFVLPEGNNQPQNIYPSFVNGKENTELRPFMYQDGKYFLPENFYPQVYSNSNQANPFLFNKPNFFGSSNRGFTNEQINAAINGGLNQFIPFNPRNFPGSLDIAKEHQINISSTESSEIQQNTTESSPFQFLRNKFEDVKRMSKSNQILLGSLVILILILSFGIVVTVSCYKHHTKKKKYPARTTSLTLLRASKQEQKDLLNRIGRLKYDQLNPEDFS